MTQMHLFWATRFSGCRSLQKTKEDALTLVKYLTNFLNPVFTGYVTAKNDLSQ